MKLPNASKMNGSSTNSESKPVSFVSIVVPAYNEDDVILEFNRRLSVVRQKLLMPSEVIFVNDGSSDNTLELLRALKAADPTIGIVDLSRKFRQGGSAYGRTRPRARRCRHRDRRRPSASAGTHPQIHRAVAGGRHHVVYGQRAARTHRYMKGLFAWIG